MARCWAVSAVQAINDINWVAAGVRLLQRPGELSHRLMGQPGTSLAALQPNRAEPGLIEDSTMISDFRKGVRLNA